MKGIKYINEDIIYISFKKHYCPNCKNKLKTVKVSKKIDSNSPEAKNYSFDVGSLGDRFVVSGEVEFVQKEFDCPNCHKHFTVKELKKAEGIDVDSSSISGETNKVNHTKNLIIFFIVGIVILLIIHFAPRLF